MCPIRIFLLGFEDFLAAGGIADEQPEEPWKDPRSDNSSDAADLRVPGNETRPTERVSSSPMTAEVLHISS